MEVKKINERKEAVRLGLRCQTAVENESLNGLQREESQ